mmetsp:Transcript_8078/g.23754  ORF Transcript_8078/g.23754 Transcript_8078/m.23754 type:complete len:98 (+) Transcript_8078:610-903(+)
MLWSTASCVIKVSVHFIAKKSGKDTLQRLLNQNGNQFKAFANKVDKLLGQPSDGGFRGRGGALLVIDNFAFVKKAGLLKGLIISLTDRHEYLEEPQD